MTYTVGDPEIKIQGADYFLNIPLCLMTLTIGTLSPWNTFLHVNRVFNIDSTGSKITIYSNNEKAETGIFELEIKFASSTSKYGTINF